MGHIWEDLLVIRHGGRTRITALSRSPVSLSCSASPSLARAFPWSSPSLVRAIFTSSDSYKAL